MNDYLGGVKAIMTDKDLTERTIFKDEFPTAHLIICLFHTFRSFKREVIFLMLLYFNHAFVVLTQK